MRRKPGWPGSNADGKKDRIAAVKLALQSFAASKIPVTYFGGKVLKIFGEGAAAVSTDIQSQSGSFTKQLG